VQIKKFQNPSLVKFLRVRPWFSLLQNLRPPKMRTYERPLFKHKYSLFLKIVSFGAVASNTTFKTVTKILNFKIKKIWSVLKKLLVKVLSFFKIVTSSFINDHSLTGKLGHFYGYTLLWKYATLGDQLKLSYVCVYVESIHKYSQLNPPVDHNLTNTDKNSGI